MADQDYNKETPDENMPTGSKGGQAQDDRINSKDLEDTDEGGNAI